MSVPRLKTCCQMCILHHIIGNDFGNDSYQEHQQFLLDQLDEGAWGDESLSILDRAVKHHAYFLTPSVVLALLPDITKELCLKECPALTEQCLDAALKRCHHLQTLDITENPNLNMSDVHLFGGSPCAPHTNLSSVTLEECPQVTDEHIQNLLRNAPNLQQLNIAWCGVTDCVFLLDEEKQLAREACLEGDERFMKGAPLTYDCRLQSVNVSRCADFSSTGVRHLCTLCGPTLRSVNLAWTKVECTAFLYLSGMSLPFAVEFFMSTGAISSAMMEPMIYHLHQFDAIYMDVLHKWGDGAKEDSSTDNSHPHSTYHSSTVEDQQGDHRWADVVRPLHCMGLDTGQGDDTTSTSNCCSSHVLKNRLSGTQFNQSETTSKIVCADEIRGSSQSHSIETDDQQSQAYSNQMGARGNAKMVLEDLADTLLEMTQTMHVSKDSDVKSNAGENDSCSQDLLGESKSKHEETFIPKYESLRTTSSSQVEDDKLLSHDTVTNLNSSDKGPIQSDLTDDSTRTSNSNSSEKKRFFNSNITSITINATVFQEELLGLKCFQKFLITNKNLLSLTIFSGLTGNFLTDNVMDLIGSYSRGLEYLSVQGSDKLTHAGIIDVAKNCRILSNLDLTGVSFVGDEGIIPLVDYLPLTQLKLAETRITEYFMNHLATLPLAQKLTDIDLSWCEEMESNSALNNVISACPQLETLLLRECCVSATTLTCIAQHSHCITELSLASNMSVMRDEGVILLTENLPMLSSIDLGWNSYLTNPSIHALLSNCPRLEKANLEGLKLITSSPFLPIVSVPVELSTYLEEKIDSINQHRLGGTADWEMKLSDLPCLPHRSTLYSIKLSWVNLTYSDFVEDTRLQQIVTITNGGIQVLDYYGNRVEPSKASLELYLTDFMDSRGEAV